MIDTPAPCDGCTGCALRCTAGIPVTRAEYLAIRRALQDVPAAPRRAVLCQPKDAPWSDGVSYRACLLLDVATQRCLVYPARPRICRLFGRVRHLPCPLGRVPADLEAPPWPAGTRPLDDWLAADGLSDPARLAADPLPEG